MYFKPKIDSTNIIKLTVLTIFLVFLSIFFYYDGLGFHEKNGINENMGQGLIYSRVLKSSEDGFFSSSGLIGLCNFSKKNIQVYHLNIYQVKKNFINCDSYLTYNSLSGVQGLIFSFIYKLEKDMRVFEIISSAFLSFSLVLLILWVWNTFGFYTSFLTFLFLGNLKYLTLLGDNIYLVIGANLLVLSGLLFSNPLNKNFPLILFGLFFLKLLLNGLEFLPTTIFMVFIPLIFFKITKNFNRKTFLHLSLTSFKIMFLALFLSILMLFFQISMAHNIEKATNHIWERLKQRTFCTPFGEGSWEYDYCKPMSYENFRVICGQYLDKETVHFFNLDIKQHQLIIFFIFIIVLSIFYYLKFKSEDAFLGLILVTIFSIICPLSYLFFQFGHSSFMGHVLWTPIVWDIPFNILGFLLTIEMSKKYLLLFYHRIHKQISEL